MMKRFLQYNNAVDANDKNESTWKKFLHRALTRCIHLFQIYLPFRLGGLGVREVCCVRYAKFIEEIIDDILPLLPQINDDGEAHGK